MSEKKKHLRECNARQRDTIIDQSALIEKLTEEASAVCDESEQNQEIRRLKRNIGEIQQSSAQRFTRICVLDKQLRGAKELAATYLKLIDKHELLNKEVLEELKGLKNDNALNIAQSKAASLTWKYAWAQKTILSHERVQREYETYQKKLKDKIADLERIAATSEALDDLIDDCRYKALEKRVDEQKREIEDLKAQKASFVREVHDCTDQYAQGISIKSEEANGSQFFSTKFIHVI